MSACLVRVDGLCWIFTSQRPVRQNAALTIAHHAGSERDGVSDVQTFAASTDPQDGNCP